LHLINTKKIMTQLKENTNCSNNCYAVTALCVSFLVLGLLVGNWMGKCSKNTKWNKAKKCQSYAVDGKAGSTCTWSAIDNKKCNKDSVK